MNDNVLLKIKEVSHSFGAKKVLHDIDLEIKKGEFIALVGPSGCGKSTLLNAIYGTLKPERGKVLVKNGNHALSSEEEILSTNKTKKISQKFLEVTRPNRNCGMVDQQYKLFENRTALRNVSIGPKLDETSIPFRIFKPREWKKIKEQHHFRAMDILKKVGLENDAYSLPRELSGGMRQRVAIAQTLIMKPKVLLLDEPFGALDEATRESLQKLLLGMYAENRQAIKKGEDPPYTVFIVTHELNEAIYVANRILGLSQHWDWRSLGYSEHPGATIVFDEPAPVFSPDDQRDFMKFKSLQEKIYKIVIDKKTCKEREEYLRMIVELRNNKKHKDGEIDEESQI